MPSDRIADILALNEQLIALESAGAAMSVGKSHSARRSTLRRVNRELPRLVGLGASVDEALDDKSLNAPPEYRALVKQWLAGADLTTLLETRRREAAGQARHKTTLASRVTYPVVVAFLACLGMVVFCYTVAPVIESTYADLRKPLSPSLAALGYLRETALYWGVAAPVVLIAIWWWLQACQPPRITRRSRKLGSVARRRLARQSADTAALLDAGRSPPDAARLAGLSHATKSAATRPPKLIAWRTRDAASPATQAADLAAIAAHYNRLADRGERRFEAIAPIVACVVVAGSATLVYGLALFLPVVELLTALGD